MTESSLIDLVGTKTRLATVIALTEHKDYIPLTSAFLDAIKNIFGVQQVNLYEVYGAGDDKATDDLLLIDVLDILSKPISFYERVNLLKFPSFYQGSILANTNLQKY